MSTSLDSKSISEVIREVLEGGWRAALVTVIESPGQRNSIGAKLIVRESGEKIGSVGDLELDEALAQQARAFLRLSAGATVYAVSDFAPQLTQTLETKILFERIESEPRLVIAGAGHVGAALARLAALVGYQVTLIDDRTEFITRQSFAGPGEENINLVAAGDWHDAIRAAIGNGRGVSVAIVTRGHKQDEECLRGAIVAKANYIGMIGSRRRTNIVIETLRSEGADENELAKVRAPIGLDIGAVSPEEVALAILAEIVCDRHGGTGSSLSNWRRN